MSLGPPGYLFREAACNLQVTNIRITLNLYKNTDKFVLKTDKKHPPCKKSKRRFLGDRRLAFRAKNSFYFIKGGSTKGGGSHRTKSEANSFANT